MAVAPVLPVAPAPAHSRIVPWKAWAFFAAASGAVSSLQLLFGLLVEGAPLKTIFSTSILGVLVWGLTGVLYAWLANRSNADLTQRKEMAKVGARAGAITAGSTAFLAGLCLLPFLLAMGAHPSFFLTWCPGLLAASIAGGAFTGALTAALVGPRVLRPTGQPAK